ncbi:MAG: aminotransferase class I/II-fold pyridoxal phosphate-dependent enzyme [Rhodobacteraceae bacterium]|nr:aminotransferase class I/II-fold pyridoxal phosphate-dependent enzyme [Paracoccaceae bacterium]
MDTPSKAQNGPSVKGFDFSTLPDYRQMSMQRAAGDLIGIDLPFFRVTSQEDGAQITVAGKRCLQFASYDYLGFNQHPDVRNAAERAVQEWGVSATASRLVGGERPFHAKLEQKIASAYSVEDALALVSGHATNVSVISALTGPKDLVLIDSLIHNSVSEGVRLSGATRLVFPHNDMSWIDRKLAEIRGQYSRVLIVVEGLYSMDGDTPDLVKLAEIKSRHDAWLMVDEAHSFGVLGKTGRGISEAVGIDPRSVEIWMGTLSKALASSGGFIAGSAALIDYLRFKAAGFVFSVALSAPLAAAASASIDLLLAEPERVKKLAENGQYFLKSAKQQGLNVGLSEGSAITPIVIGDSMRAIIAANLLLESGINALPIIFPAVPEKQARLRFFVTATHSRSDLDYAIKTLVDVMKKVEMMPDLATMIRQA